LKSSLGVCLVTRKSNYNLRIVSSNDSKKFCCDLSIIVKLSFMLCNDRGTGFGITNRMILPMNQRQGRMTRVQRVKVEHDEGRQERVGMGDKDKGVNHHS
jgi:hypothetical protein